MLSFLSWYLSTKCVDPGMQVLFSQTIIHTIVCGMKFFSSPEPKAPGELIV